MEMIILPSHHLTMHLVGIVNGKNLRNKHMKTVTTIAFILCTTTIGYGQIQLNKDKLGWGAILIGSIMLLFKDIPLLDPCLSLLITLYILWNAIKNLRETLFIFL